MRRPVLDCRGNLTVACLLPEGGGRVSNVCIVHSGISSALCFKQRKKQYTGQSAFSDQLCSQSRLNFHHFHPLELGIWLPLWCHRKYLPNCLESNFRICTWVGSQPVFALQIMQKRTYHENSRGRNFAAGELENISNFPKKSQLKTTICSSAKNSGNCSQLQNPKMQERQKNGAARGNFPGRGNNLSTGCRGGGIKAS